MGLTINYANQRLSSSVFSPFGPGRPPIHRRTKESGISKGNIKRRRRRLPVLDLVRSDSPRSQKRRRDTSSGMRFNGGHRSEG